MSEMIMTIVVADTSGSMREHGKLALIRNLIGHLREREQHARGDASAAGLVIVRWSTDAEVVVAPPEEDLPSWPAEGQTSVAPLIALLDSLCTGDAHARLLLLSDGHCTSADVSALKAWRRRCPRVSVRALAIGPDAAAATLGKITGPNGVFAAEEIIAALTSWGVTEKPPLPDHLAALAQRPELGAP